MWLPVRQTDQPGESWWDRPIRSTNGELFPSSFAMSIPTFISRYEALNSSSGFRTYNPCQHFVKGCSLDRPKTSDSNTWYQATNHALGYWIWGNVPTIDIWQDTRHGPSYGSPSQAFGEWQNPTKGLPTLYVIDQYGKKYVNPPNQFDTKYLIDRSLNAMLPGINSEASILNTLYELKDMKTLSRSLTRINGALDATERLKQAYGLSKQAIKLFGTSRKALANASLRSVLKAGADSYLQAQFNIGPLLRDIAVLQNVYASAYKQLMELLVHAGRLQRRHYRADTGSIYRDSDENYQGSTLSTIFVPRKVYGARSVRYTTRMFYATIEYRYKLYPQFDRLEDYLPLAIQDVLGINLDPSIVWNAIPWSFLVDWTIGVSRWLQQFRVRQLEPVTHISRYCYSFKTRREIKLSVAYDGNPVPFARTVEDTYIRVPFNPDMQRSIVLNGLNLKKFSLAGALALTKRG